MLTPRNAVLAAALLLLLAANVTAQQTPSIPRQEGYLPTPDGPRLYFQKLGRGKRVLIVPLRIFSFPELEALADEFTVIGYDTRNRGKSDFVLDGKTLTIEQDVRDLETVRKHFGIEKFSASGYSYVGKMIVLYALAYPTRIERLVQIGPVPLKFGTRYPEHLTASDDPRDPEARARVRKLIGDDYHLTHPQQYCEEEWKVNRVRLVGNPAAAEKLPSQCAMPNEWPTYLARQMQHHFVENGMNHSVPPESIAQARVPVLTIHGTKDRNAPYAAGREWGLLLPDQRLLTVEGAAHQVHSEFPEIVIPAMREFLRGQWPAAAQKVTKLDPAS